MKRPSCSGFTMMELMVTVAIVSVIGGVLMAVIRMNQQSWEVSQSHLAVSMQLRRGMDAMSRELTATQATQVDIPADGAWYESITFAVPWDNDGDGSVLDGSGVLEWSDPITYELGGDDGDQALRSQDGVDDRVMANGVTVLEFRREAATPNIVEMRMEVRRATHTGDFPNTGELTTRVRLRN